MFTEYGTEDVCWRVAKAYRKQAETWVCKMKAMTTEEGKTCLAENDFKCNGTSKQIRANHMCFQFQASSNKGFEAKFAEEVKCILHENAMVQNIKKHPDVEDFIRVEELKYVTEIELSSNGKRRIKSTEAFTDIDEAVNMVKTTLRAEATRPFGNGIANVEKALQVEEGAQAAFDTALIESPEKQKLEKSTSEECVLDIKNSSTIDLTPSFFAPVKSKEKPPLHPLSNVTFRLPHLRSMQMHFIQDRLHICTNVCSYV